jgi:hypothetical protein
VNIEYSPNSDFIFGIAAIVTILFASFLFASAWLSVDNRGVSKIDDVRHIEGLDEIDNIEKIDETYELSEIGLTDKQKQQIMNEKSVTTKKELTIDDTVALTTDSGSYIVNVKTIHPTILVELIMSLVSFILFFCMIFVPNILDNRFWRDVFQLFAVGGSIVSISFVCAFFTVIFFVCAFFTVLFYYWDYEI